jgi:thiol-disulfide isomerase/thioredoxin
VASHERLQGDLSRMISLILAGRKDAARAVASPSTRGEIASLPAFDVVDVDGKRLSRADLAGRVVLVEFWATWCPPCRGTLSWLGQLKKRYGNRIAVVAVSIDSDEANVRKLSHDLGAPLFFTLGTPELARSFGDVSAVPSLFLFDRTGKTAATFFGAPPELHAEAESKISAIAR